MTTLAFLAGSARGHFDMIDRDTGEVLGTVWRASRGTWSAAGPDGVTLIERRTGSRDATGVRLLTILTILKGKC
ncbi:MAG: hypothetical protein ACOH10_07830 [Rhodoglobus sp.]